MGSTSNQRMILGVLVALCGLGLWFILARTNQPPPVKMEAPKVEAPPATVVVAAEPLKFGDEMARRKLTVIEWPRDSVPTGSFSNIDQIVGGGKRRVALSAIEPNEPILKSKISGFGGRATLAQVIAPGMRAFTIRTNEVAGVAGLLLPGDRVDLVMIRSKKGRGGGTVSHGLMQNVRILAVDQRVDGSGGKKSKKARTLTLEVTPDGAQKLALATSVGRITLTLRNAAADVESASINEMGVTRMSDLGPTRRPRPVKRAPAAPVAPGTEVIVVRGGKRVPLRVPHSPEQGVTSYSAPFDGAGNGPVQAPVGVGSQPANRAASNIDAGLLPAPSVQTWRGREN